MLCKWETGRLALIGFLGTVVMAGCSQSQPTAKSIVPVPTTTFIPKGPQTYTIVFKPYPDQGKSVEHRHNHKQTKVVRITDGEGKELSTVQESLISDMVFTDTVLEKGEVQPKRFKRFYTKAAEKVNDQDFVHRPYEGRTILFEWKGGSYEAEAEGKPPLDPQDLRSILQRFSRPDSRETLLPKGPVKINETWSIDLPRWEKNLRAKLDLPHSSGTVKLVKVQESGSDLFGVMELNLSLAVRSMFGLDFNPPGRFELKGTLETAVAGTSTAGSLETTGRFSGKGVREDKGVKTFEEITMEFSGKEVRSAQK